MAEIFGVAAGVVGVLDASVSVSNKLREAQRRWKSAISELDALQKEIKSLQSVLNHAYNVCILSRSLMALEQQNGQRDELESTLEQLVGDAREIFRFLEIFVEDIASGSDRHKKKTWVTKKGQVEAKKAELGRIRIRIWELLHTHNADATVYICDAVTGIKLTISQHNRTLMEIQNQILKLDSQASTILDRMPAATMGHIEELDDCPPDSGCHPATSPLPSSSSASPSKISTSPSPPGGIPTDPGDDRNHLLAKVAESDPPQTTLSMQTTSCSIEAICDGLCKCRCHARAGERPSSRWKISLLQGLFGVLRATSYMAPSLQDETCDLSTCQRRKTSAYHLEYELPRWFMQQSIRILWKQRMERPPSVHLRLVVRLPTEEWKILGLVFVGDRFRTHWDSKDVESLLSFIADDPECVHHRNRYGKTVLNSIFNAWPVVGNDVVVQVLLRAGADLYCEDDNGLTPGAQIALHYLEFRGDRGLRKERIDAVLPMSRIIDEIDLSPVTKVILGHQDGNVASVLANLSSGWRGYISLLDEPDGTGNTPMHWAATMCDRYTLGCLISAGADVNAKDSSGQTPLMIVTKSYTDEQQDKFECVQLLVDSGADLLAQDRFGTTVLYWVCSDEGGDHRVDELFKQRYMNMTVADTNIIVSKNRHGRTALHCAALTDKVEWVEYLLAEGADIEAREYQGRTPLMDTFIIPACRAYSCLVRNGANRAALNPDGRTMLHYAAHFANSKMMDTLAHFGLPGVDVDHEDARGNTAKYYFERRSGKTDALQSAFDHLLHVVKNGLEPWLDVAKGDHDDSVHSDDGGSRTPSSSPACAQRQIGDDNSSGYDSNDSDSVYKDSIKRPEKTIG